MDSDDIIDFKGETFMEKLLVNYRWILVCFVVLPMSFLYDLWFYTRNKIIFYFNSAPQAHNEKVRKVQQQVMHEIHFTTDFSQIKCQKIK